MRSTDSDSAKQMIPLLRRGVITFTSDSSGKWQAAFACHREDAGTTSGPCLACIGGRRYRIGKEQTAGITARTPSSSSMPDLRFHQPAHADRIHCGAAAPPLSLSLSLTDPLRWVAGPSHSHGRALLGATAQAQDAGEEGTIYRRERDAKGQNRRFLLPECSGRVFSLM
jgi:hypothetical protein